MTNLVPEEGTLTVTARITEAEAEKLRAMARATGIKFELMAGAAIRSGVNCGELQRGGRQ